MRAQWNDKQILEKISLANSESVESGCMLITKDTKNSMKAGSYRPYKSRKGDGSIHYSSQPGTPPAPDTRLLRGSISYQTSDGKSGGIEGPASQEDGIGKPSGDDLDIVGAIGTRRPEGYWLEISTPNMEARPFLGPQLANKKEIVKAIFKSNIIKVIS